MVGHIAKSDGPRGLYAGLSAALARQLSYGTMRIGMFEWLRDATYQGPVDDMGVAHKLAIGLVSGAVAAVSCCPVEVSLVRMQADSAAPGPRDVSVCFALQH
jgi:solute carrier family 25 oxoglutarate transporter 11